MITPHQRIEDFYRMLHGSVEGNNHVYKVEATVHDGSKPIRIVFDSPQGFASDQKQRIGTLEVKADE